MNPNMALETEKVNVLEKVAEVDKNASLKTEDEAIYFNERQTKALLRKLDWHLVPFLSLLHLLTFLE